MKNTFIVFLFCLSFTARADLKKVSRNDIQEIKSLFYYLIQHHDFGYTIFGSKPMSLADINLELPPGLPLFKQLKARFILKKTKKWIDAWYKNKQEFEIKDFIFLDKEEDFIRGLVVVLINKENLLKVLHAHELIFKQEIGESFIPESFLEKIRKREISLAQAIHRSQRLLGIMLGYGERNAALFQERFDLQKEISKKKKEGLEEDTPLVQKLIDLESQAGEFSEFEENAIIPPLYFLADLSHPETIQLKHQYKADCQRIEQLKKQPHFMDKVLERLIE